MEKRNYVDDALTYNTIHQSVNHQRLVLIITNDNIRSAQRQTWFKMYLESSLVPIAKMFAFPFHDGSESLAKKFK